MKNNDDNFKYLYGPISICVNFMVERIMNFILSLGIGAVVGMVLAGIAVFGVAFIFHKCSKVVHLRK